MVSSSRKILKQIINFLIIILLFIPFISSAEEIYIGKSAPTPQQVLDTLEKHPNYPKDITFSSLAETESGAKRHFVFVTYSSYQEDYWPLERLDSNEWVCHVPDRVSSEPIKIHK
jgi:hypothetical protein